MFITLKEILKNELFYHSEILAGHGGLEREVKRISVFDCPCDPNLVQRNILMEGDAFITSLEQFKYESEKVYDFIDVLIETGSAGIFVITTEMKKVLYDDIIERCNHEDFPIILIPEDIPYAAIIDTVNKYIAIDNLNALNMLKLEKMLYGNINSGEKMEILYSINPHIKTYLRVIGIEGDFNSDIAQMELHTYYLNKKNDIYVRSKHQMVIILSDEDEKQLRHHSDAASIRLKEFIDNPKMGYSRIYHRRDISKALEESRRALDTARTMKMESQTYEPMSVLQLLLPIRDTQEAYDFYYGYVEAVKSKVAADSLRDVLLTLETYVANSGNYAKTAADLNQHENTIRYRVNKVKSALGMEEDNIKFNETVAIAVKLRILIKEEI